MLTRRSLIVFVTLSTLFHLPGAAVAATLELKYPRPTLSTTNVRRVQVATLPLSNPSPNGEDNINGRHYLIEEDNPSQDLEILLPTDRALRYPIRTVGFRKIVIIGGLMKPLEGTSALKFDGLHSNSEVYLEGLLIDMSETRGDYSAGRAAGQADAINTTAPSGSPIVTLQNLRLENVMGVQDWGVGWHGDAFQHQSGTLELLRVHNVTATGNYQLFFVPTLDGATLLRTYFSNVNGRWNGVPGDSERPWMFFFRNRCSSPRWNQATLDNVWMEARAGYTVPAHHVRPSSSAPCGAIDKGTYLEFKRQTSGVNVTPEAMRNGQPADVLVGGRLHYGAPPGGDFAPAGLVGLNYLKPGTGTVAVTGLTLVEGGQGVSESGFQELVDGTTIDPEQHPTINVRADVSSTTDRVRFLLSGAESLDRSESAFPLALQGDNGSTYNAWAPTPGGYTLTVIPYDAQGVAGPEKVVDFTVVDPAPPTNPNATVTKVALVRGGQSVDEYGLKLMTDGTVIDLSSTGPINMRADGSSAVDSIRFVLTGPESLDRTESAIPYALKGDDSRVFESWTPTVGDYLLRVIPYDASGAVGPETAIHFTVQP